MGAALPMGRWRPARSPKKLCACCPSSKRVSSRRTDARRPRQRRQGPVGLPCRTERSSRLRSLNTVHMRITRRSIPTLVASLAVLAAHPAPPARHLAREPGEWTLVFAYPAVGKYEDLAFPDEKHGWIVSASGRILATTDG